MTPPSRECGSHAQKQTSWSSWSLQEEKPGSPLMMMSCWWRSLWRIPGTVAQTVEWVVLAPPDRHPRLPQTRRGPGVRRHARQRCVPVWEGLQRPEEASEDHRGSAGGECCSRGDRNLTHACEGRCKSAVLTLSHHIKRILKHRKYSTFYFCVAY